ncbi:UNKNOWN [Stylonychia lemnae]|uniref:Uncharacterized protein n=1 Tax=Stylonychia lemnae TaxID=5949 RepID=A0A077ZZE7_STYLE|nr:UNKNOWN [Stylonychia lemnae]|eukprot:CDW74598.1 UNKNOWN [Stylonychia lemnae]
MILVNVARALYFIFRAIFCNWQQTNEDFGLEYFIQEKGQDQNENYFEEARKSTLKRSQTKQQTKDSVVNDVQLLWTKVMDTLGKYNKIIEYVASKRVNMYINLFNATSNGQTQLDTIEKYCIIKDLREQIHSFSEKLSLVQTKKRNMSINTHYYGIRNIARKDDSNQNLTMQQSLLDGYSNNLNFKNFRMNAINIGDEESQSMSNTSFDQLKLEDDVDEFMSKWQVCKDILEKFTVRPQIQNQQQPQQSYISQDQIQQYIFELYVSEILDTNNKQEFEDYLSKSDNFTAQDQKYLNQINEILFKREVEMYNQKSMEQQKYLEQIQIEAQQKIKTLDFETTQIKMKFQQEGQYERYEKVKDERKSIGNQGYVISPSNEIIEIFSNLNILTDKQQLRVDQALLDLQNINAKFNQDENQAKILLHQMEKLENDQKIIQ